MSEFMTMTNPYAKFAMHIHACKQEVTIERLKVLFESTGFEFSIKLASMFVFQKEKYANLLMSVNSVPSGALATPDKNKEEYKKEISVNEEESESDEGFEMF